MDQPASYQTRQRECIWNFLKKHQDRHVSVDEVVDHLRREGNQVGKSTVYRYLEKLRGEGLVRRYFLEEGQGACFQLLGEREKCREHFHLKCVECGELIHVQCDYLSQVEGHLLAEHGFWVDNCKTVLYGLCEVCKKGEKHP